MREIDRELTLKKFMTLCYLWPYSKKYLIVSLAILKVPGTVRIIEGHAIYQAIKELKENL